jgi:membrane protein implicated in regulation of membrane protease activity
MRRGRIFNVGFVVACATAAYFTGTLGRFLYYFTVIAVAQLITYIATWKMLDRLHKR